MYNIVQLQILSRLKSYLIFFNPERNTIFKSYLIFLILKNKYDISHISIHSYRIFLAFLFLNIPEYFQLIFAIGNKYSVPRVSKISSLLRARQACCCLTRRKRRGRQRGCLFYEQDERTWSDWLQTFFLGTISFQRSSRCCGFDSRWIYEFLRCLDSSWDEMGMNSGTACVWQD